jgi:hypothetical protein
MRRHREEAPPPLAELNPLVPAGFAAVVQALLAKRPDERPASAEAVRQQLLTWADAEPAGPGPVPVRTDSAVVAEAEAEEAREEAGSSWEWLPPVSLAETARPGRPWWAEAGPVARTAVFAAAGLAMVALLVLLWAALRG